MSILIERLHKEYGYPLVDQTSLPVFLQQQACSVLFFTEDAKRFPESNDVAVVLPELVKAFAGQFTPAVVSRSAEKGLQHVYGFTSWPALVFLRGEQYLGCITGIQDWAVYLSEIKQLLAASPRRPPAIGIAITQH